MSVKNGVPRRKGYGLYGRIAYLLADTGLTLSRLPVIRWLTAPMASRRSLKVVTVPVDAVIRREPAILPFDVARQLIEASSYIVVANTCMCREGHNCEDYPTDLGCLFLGQGAKRVTMRGRTRPVTREEALAHVKRAVSLGLVTNAIWSTVELAMIGGDPASTVELCFCCPCCCLAFKTKNASRAFVDGITGLGISAVNNPDDCTRCHNCVNACPFAAVSVSMRYGPIIDPARCKGCGRCETVCHPGVLKIIPARTTGGSSGPKILDEFLDMVK